MSGAEKQGREGNKEGEGERGRESYSMYNVCTSTACMAMATTGVAQYVHVCAVCATQ